YLPSFGYCLLVGAKLAPSDVPASARSRAPLVALGVLIAAVALARTLAFGTLAHAARQSVDDALAAWDAMPRAAEVLVVDLAGPPLRHRPGRSGRPAAVAGGVAPGGPAAGAAASGGGLPPAGAIVAALIRDVPSGWTRPLRSTRRPSIGSPSGTSRMCRESSL